MRKIESFCDLIEFCENNKSNKDNIYGTITSRVSVNVGSYERLVPYPISETKALTSDKKIDFSSLSKLNPGSLSSALLFYNRNEKTISDNIITIKNQINAISQKIEQLKGIPEILIMLSPEKKSSLKKFQNELREKRVRLYDLINEKETFLKKERESKKQQELLKKRKEVERKEEAERLKLELESEDWYVILAINNRYFKLEIADLKKIFICSLEYFRDPYLISFYLYLRTINEVLIRNKYFLPNLKLTKFEFNNESHIFISRPDDYIDVGLQVRYGPMYYTDPKDWENDYIKTFEAETENNNLDLINTIKERLTKENEELTNNLKKKQKYEQLLNEILNIPGGELDRKKLNLENLKKEKIKFKKELTIKNIEDVNLNKDIKSLKDEKLKVLNRKNEIISDQEAFNKMEKSFDTNSIESEEIKKRLRDLSLSLKEVNKKIKYHDIDYKKKIKLSTELNISITEIKKKITEIQLEIDSIKI